MSSFVLSSTTFTRTPATTMVTDVVQRDVTALRRIVEAAIRILLDDAFFAHAKASHAGARISGTMRALLHGGEGRAGSIGGVL